MIMEAGDLLEGSPSSFYYRILGVSLDSSVEEIRRAYRKLAMQWHPDRWTRTPSLLAEAKRKFQHIQEAYSVLSDDKKRRMYDAGLYDPEDEDDEGFSDFVEEMLSLMAQVRREEKDYSMEELRNMFNEMAQGWYFGASVVDESQCSKKMRMDNGGSPFHVPGLKLFETSSYCN